MYSKKFHYIDSDKAISDVYVTETEILPLLDRSLLECNRIAEFVINYGKNEISASRFYNIDEIKQEISWVREAVAYEKDYNINPEEAIRRAMELASGFLYFTTYKSPYDVERPHDWQKWVDGRYRTYFHTDEAKKKIGAAQLGRKRSEETKKKISEKLKGRKLSPEHCKNMSEVRKGKAPPRHKKVS